uniref:Periplasmic divalent cation tolerance protein cutA n=1 Tax=uncultured bacterium contig00078 TaxID=1181556 RepID=A0A806KNW7_9BACT|nr:periplasmic divalent cation tolerance protein cutA [uncultured bacterium contig00078]
MGYCIVLTTTAAQEEADKIAAVLLENRLAACVQISPVTSVYRWKGKVERDNELRLVIKTTDELYPKVEKLIKENHSYEVPQIVKTPITGGLPEYLDWISGETG